MRNKKLIYIFIIFLIILFFFGLNPGIVFGSSSYVSDTEGGKVTFTLDNGVWSVQGTFTGKNINYTYSVSNDSDYNIIPFLREKNGTIYYSYFKVPFNSTYYATRYKTTGYLYFDFICNENYFYCDDNNGGNILVNIAANTSKRIDNRSTYCMCTFYSTDGQTILFEIPEPGITSFPYIMNKDSDLAKGNSDIIIMPEQFSNSDDIRFVIQKITEFTTDTGIYEEYISCFETIILNSSSDYYVQVGDTGSGFYYKIPWSFIEEYLEEGSKYSFVLAYNANNEDFRVDKVVEYVGLSSTDIYNSISSDIKNTTNTIVATINQSNENLQKSIEQQTEVQEEQLETSKGIWASIKEVISYINPFSENFFVYKLIDLLIDALKSLFIPGEGFLDTYFSELLNWFSDRLGFLSYPLELILDVLNRILTINFEEPIINIPDIYEPSTNQKIISERSFNFNSLLENNTLKTVHDIYLILVDAVIVFGLVNLLKNKLEEVFTK